MTAVALILLGCCFSFGVGMVALSVALSRTRRKLERLTARVEAQHEALHHAAYLASEAMRGASVPSSEYLTLMSIAHICRGMHETN